jgi:hypothetical protein
MLFELFRDSPVAALANLLEPDPSRAMNLFRSRLGRGPNLRSHLEAVLRAYLLSWGRVREEARPVVPLPKSIPTRDELRGWAEGYDLFSVLKRKIRHEDASWLGPLAGGPIHLSLLQMLVSPSLAWTGPRWLPGETEPLIRARAESWLLGRAHAVEFARARQRSLDRLRSVPPPDPLVASLASCVANALAGMTVAREASGVGELRVAGSFELPEPDPAGPLTLAWQWSGFRVEIDLTPWRAGTFLFKCSCWTRESGRACVHTAAATSALLDVLHGAQPEVLAPLVARLRQLSWGRSAQKIDAALARFVHPRGPIAPESLLSFRIVGFPRPRVEAYRHTRTAAGEWSKGMKVPLEDAGTQEANGAARLEGARGLFCAAERLARFSDFYHPGDSSHLELFAAGLQELAGYPLVFFGDAPDKPIAIEQGSLSLSVERTAEGSFVLAPAVDGDTTLGVQLASQRDGAAVAVLRDERRHRAVLVRTTAAQRALLASLPLAAECSAAQVGELMGRLSALEHHVPLALPPELVGEPVPADPRLVLRLSPGSDRSLQVEMLVRPLSGGPSFLPGAGPARVSAFAGDRRVHADRDLGAELALARGTAGRIGLPEAAAGGQAPVNPWSWSLAGDPALDLLASLERLRPDEAVIEWPDETKRIRVYSPLEGKQLRVRIEDRHDWFGLSGELSIDGQQVALAALLEAVRLGTRYVAVGPNQWVALSDELRKRLSPVSDVTFAGRAGLEVSLAAAAALEDLLDGAAEATLCARYRDSLSRMRAAAVSEPSLPSGLRAELRPYQVDGFRWLARMSQWGVGACLADDMGLGKTLQALAILLDRAERGPALVVAPTSVCFNWVREAERFAPGLRPRLFREGDRAATLAGLEKGDLLVCSYGLMVLHAQELAQIRFSTLVLDEAQVLKNAATQRARAARDLDAEWRVALSGTPLENHLGELWSLFRIVVPGLLGSWEMFRERFANPIERQKNPERLAALSRVVRPFILRRLKIHVARDLPERTEIRDVVALSHAERALYDQARLAAIAHLAGEVEESDQQRRFRILAAITRLRQLACNPRLVDPDSKIRSAKLERLLELVDELRDNGHRALVFSQFTQHLALVREALEARRISYLYLDGQTPEGERARRVDAFQRGEADLFLISLKAGGTGLNLTAADYVIHLDPWWNPAVEDQATDRAHRIGQEKPVTVYRLVTKGTIEEAIVGLHQEKRDLVAGVLDGAAAAGRLSTDQLLALIRAGEDAPEVSDEDDAVGAEAAPGGEGRAPPEAQARSSDAPAASPESAAAAELSERFRKYAEGCRIGPPTVIGYTRSVKKFADWALKAGAAPSADVADLAGMIDEYLEGLASGRISCTASEPKVARAALAMLRKWAAKECGS